MPTFSAQATFRVTNRESFHFPSFKTPESDHIFVNNSGKLLPNWKKILGYESIALIYLMLSTLKQFLTASQKCWQTTF